MEQLIPIGIFLFVLFFLLGSGVWVGLALLGVAWVGMELFTSRPAGARSSGARPRGFWGPPVQRPFGRR